MKIAYFVTHFPDTEYEESTQKHRKSEAFFYVGAVLSAFHLAHHMAARGHEVHVFTTAVDTRQRIQRDQDLTIHRYRTNFRVDSGSMSLGMFRYPLLEDMDIVHAHFSAPPCTLAALWYAKRKKRPLIVTYHGDWDDSYGSVLRRIGLSLYNKFLLPQILASATLLTSPTRRYIEQSRFLYHYRDKTIPVPNGVVLEDFEIAESPSVCRQRLDLPPDTKILLYVGSLTDYKGLDVLLKAMPDVLLNVPETQLVLVGDGRLRRALEALSRELKIADRVLFAGFVRDVAVKARYYSAANLFVLPSTLPVESFGMVNLEAMACGVPIVGSTIGGIPDVVEDGKEGLLVPPGDVQALARAITKLLNDDTLRSEMSNRGREKVQNYSWHRVAQEMEEVYRQVLAD